MGAKGENSGKDLWEYGDREAVRKHRRPRRSLFTPLRVSGAPPAKSLTPLRITRGRYHDNEEEFEIVDCWTSRATAHRALTRIWSGTTTFLQRCDE